MKQIIEIYRLIGENSQKKIPLFFFLTVISTLLEILSIGLIVPLIGFLSDSSDSYISNFLLRSYDIYILLTVVLLVYLIKTIYLIFFNKWQNDLIFDINLYLSNQLFDRYLNIDYSFYLKRNSSELVRNIVNLENFAHNIIQSIILISEIILVICFSLILFFFQPIITLYSLAIGILLSFIFIRIINLKIIKAGELYQNQSKKIIEQVNQSLNNIKEIKIYQKETFFAKKFFEDSKIYNSAIKKNQFLKSLPRILIEFIAVSIVVLIILFMIIENKNFKDILVFVALFVAVGFRFIPSFNKILSSIHHLKFYLKLTDNIKNDFNLINNYPEKDKIIYFNKTIELKNISFYYEDKKNILSNISLSIKKNSVFGIFGKTGSGKTTLINILIGLLKPTEGILEIDGIPSHLNNVSWLKKIGYVSQRVSLNQGSVAENVAFGNSKWDIDEDRLSEIIKLSMLQSFSAESNFLERDIKEIGKNLSGGQIQRMGIARALYIRPEILILDEATSNLDKQIENKIIQAIKELSKQTTVIIITHDPNLIKECDFVYNLR